VRALWTRLRSLPEPPASPSGVVWTLAVAALFFYLSNPLSMVPFFGDSLHRSILVASTATVLTLPWLRLPRIPWAVLPVVALMYASLQWTLTWDVTWGVTMVYVKVALIAWACTWSTDVRTLAHGLHLGGVVVVITSLYAYWAGLPFADVPPGATGFLAGVGANRNILGYTLVLAWAAALAHVPSGRFSRPVWGVGATTVGFGLFLAQSATAFVVAALVAGLALGLAQRDRLTQRVGPRRLVTVIGGGFAALGVLVAVGLLLGRDLGTLSGRTQIWSAIWDATYGQRLLGQGWGTTWPHAWVQAPPNPVYEYVNANYGAGVVAHGHSSLMDVMPDLGVVGMTAFALAYAAVAALAVRRWWRTPASAARVDPGAGLTILLLVALVTYGATEPLATTPLGWFLLVLLAGLAGRPTLIATPDPAVHSGVSAGSAHDASSVQPGLAGRHRDVRG
jgi:O-antigen ligase